MNGKADGVEQITQKPNYSGIPLYRSSSSTSTLLHRTQIDILWV